MLCAHLLEGPSTKAWVDKVPGIMLTLNAMPHEPHGFSASMVATGRKPALPPDLVSDTSPSPASEDAPGYVETIQQRFQLTHQQMTTPPAAPASNPYHEGSLVYMLTTPPERTSKLAPRWKGPFRVCRISNEYQVTYEDDGLERTVHINHAKPAKFMLQIFQNQCHLSKHHALLWDISPQASLGNPLSLVPLLLPPTKLPWLPQPLQQCPSLDLLQLP